MLTRNTTTESDLARFGEDNARIMRERLWNRRNELIAMYEVNEAWHDRMWQTPDIAMCLGRYKSAKQSKRYAK